jgi:hypothetical protein
MNQILPLAITMMAGPQIMSAIIFITTDRAVRLSLAFLAGVAIAVLLGVAIARGLAALFGNSVSLGGEGDDSSVGKIIQFALVGLLVAASIRSYVKRESIEPPKWLGKLQTAGPSLAFRTGLLVILLMPSDVAIMLTTGFHLEQSGEPYTHALPFAGLTVLIAALPLLGYLLFHRRARTAMPKVRDWMNSHAWLVNIIVYCIFIVLIL